MWAAAIASRFVPKGQPIFKLVREGQEKPFFSNADPLFSGPIMVLVDHSNAGVSETVAAVLRSKVHALLIGGKTSGRAVEYTQFPIGKRLLLSVATQQIEVPGQPSIFPNGLSPDIVVQMPEGEEINILELGDTKGIFDLVRDEERPHTNEAALVAGKSPDIDAYEADQAAGGNPVKPKDPAVQRAIDVLTAISIYHGK
jgi:C-terminal processing protease CtpA/Prc